MPVSCKSSNGGSIPSTGLASELVIEMGNVQRHSRITLTRSTKATQEMEQTK
jgi:hypothetical protein